MASDSTENAPNSYQIAVRFGDEILQAGFTAIPNLVLDHYADLGITPGEMLFTIHVWQYWWSEKNPYPSLQGVADKMNASRRQVRRYAEGLKDKGLLKVNERRLPGVGQITSEYDFSPLIRAIVAIASERKSDRSNLSSPPGSNLSEGGRTDSSGGARKKMSPEEYTGRKDEDQEYEGVVSNIRRKNDQKNLENKILLGQENSRSAHSGSRAEKPAEQIPSRSNGDTVPLGEAIAAWKHRQEATAANGTPAGAIGAPASSEQNGTSGSAAASTRQPRRRGRPPGSTEERERLVAYLRDFAIELGDEAPLAATVTRALNTFKAATVPPEFWGDHLYSARAITQERTAQITKQARDGNAIRRKNKMPYFFEVLEDLVGLRPEPTRRSDDPKP